MSTKWEIDPDLTAFIGTLRASGDLDDRSFRDAVAGILLHDALLGYGDIATALAGELQVAPSTIWRWARGSSAPMPSLRRYTLQAAAPLLEAREAEARERHKAAHAAFRQLSLAAQDAMEDDDD